MATSWGRIVAGFSALGMLAACSSSSSGGTPGGGGETGEGGAPASSECVSQPDAVFPARQFGETDLIRQIAVDADTLFFRTETTLFSVPKAGGDVQTVADLSAEGPSEFWMTGDALLVRAQGDLLSIPKGGGAPVKVGSPLAPAPSNFANAQLDGTTLYWIASDSSGYGVYSRALTGSASKQLYSTKDEIKYLQNAGAALYFVDKATSTIQSLPLSGGAPTKLIDADSSDEIIGADATELYVIGSIGAPTSTNYGLYRQPLSGDSATLLDNELFIDVPTATSASGAYFSSPANDSPNHGDPTDVAPSLLFAAPSATMTIVRWCIDPSYTVHALAVDGNTAYVSVYKTSANQATIARVPVP
ncbi:MAG TPA: hypothetical protein VGL19_16535 [Polyangiaceae bacterium]